MTLLTVGAVWGILVAPVVAEDRITFDPHEMANWTDLAWVP